MHTVLLWPENVGAELKEMGLERFQEDLRVLSKEGQENVGVITMVYMDDLLLSSAMTHHREQALEYI